MRKLVLWGVVLSLENSGLFVIACRLSCGADFYITVSGFLLESGSGDNIIILGKTGPDGLGRSWVFLSYCLKFLIP